MRRVIKNQKEVILQPESVTKVPVELRAPTAIPDRDYFFLPSYLGTYAHIVDANMSFVCVKNSLRSAAILPRHPNLGTVVEYDAEYCHAAHPDHHELAAEKQDLKVHAPEGFTEVKLDNGISICGDDNQVARLKALISEYGAIWEDTGDIINIAPEDHMKINLNTDWNSTSAPKFAQRIYPLGLLDRAAVDKEFDKLHAQGRMGWS